MIDKTEISGEDTTGENSNVKEDTIEEIVQVEENVVETTDQVKDKMTEKKEISVEETIDNVKEDTFDKGATEEIDNVDESSAKTSKENNAPTNEIKNIPLDAVVHATVLLENSPQFQVTQSYLNLISQLIDSKEHLQRNIKTFRFGNITNLECGNNVYKHQVQVILEVKSSQLWESARSYLFRHLGTNRWTLQDGTEVSMVRIHQR